MGMKSIPVQTPVSLLLKTHHSKNQLLALIHELNHVITYNLDGFNWLVVVHCHPNDVMSKAEGMAPNVKPSKVVVRLAQELLNKGNVGILCACPNGKHHLHAGSELCICDERVVETTRRINAVVQEIGALESELLKVRDATFSRSSTRTPWRQAKRH